MPSTPYSNPYHFSLNRLLPKSESPRPLTFDAFVISPFCPVSVIPAKAGIQEIKDVMDSRFRGSDGLMTFYEFVNP